MPWRTAFSTSVSSVIGGQRSVSADVIDVQRELQPIGHAHVHELEVRADQLELLAERRGRLVQARHGGAQVGDQAAQHGGGLRRSRVDQRLHVGQRVEQEVRRDLRLQQAQARVERLALELAALELERQRLSARASASFCRTSAASATHGASNRPRKHQPEKPPCGPRRARTAGAPGCVETRR